MRSENFDKRQSDISMLLLHYTGMENCAQALERLCARATKVSAHYVIDEAGAVYNLVDDGARAWHAGESFWRGIKDINSCSIGIELVNGGHAHALPNYPEAQMNSLEDLAQKLCAQYKIKFVLGHSDVAPDRKLDPGEKFAWQRLARKGIGLWVKAPPPDENFHQAEEVLPKLKALGYNPNCSAAVLLQAFQRHWRPARVDGKLDDSTSKTLDAVLEKL